MDECSLKMRCVRIYLFECCNPSQKITKKTIIARVKVVLTKVYKKVKSFCSELVQRKMTDIY